MNKTTQNLTKTWKKKERKKERMGTNTYLPQGQGLISHMVG
jgi:hypothetical protein